MFAEIKATNTSKSSKVDHFQSKPNGLGVPKSKNIQLIELSSGLGKGHGGHGLVLPQFWRTCQVSEPMQRLAEIQHLFEGLGSSACEALLAASQLIFLAPLLLRNLHSCWIANHP